MHDGLKIIHSWELAKEAQADYAVGKFRKEWSDLSRYARLDETSDYAVVGDRTC